MTMNRWIRNNWQMAAAIGGVGIAGWFLTRKSGSLASIPCEWTPPESNRIQIAPHLPRGEVEAKIRSEARRQGVPEAWALAFSDQETNLQSGFAADLDWPWRRGNLEKVQAKYPNNPYKNCQGVWVTYGLFGLLSYGALKEVNRNAHPKVLQDPDLNIRLGVTGVGRVFHASSGNYLLARRVYIGCSRYNGTSTGKCSTGYMAGVDSRSSRVAGRWGIAV